MKCPKCGNEIPDGALFCENCATEIKMVPEYEAKLEEQIILGMEEAAKVIAEEKGELPPAEAPENSGEDAVPENLTDELPDERPEKSANQQRALQAARRAKRLARYAARRRYVKFMIVFMIGALFATACLILFYSGDLYQRTHSKSYYVGKAYQLSCDGKYQQAADEIDKAIALGPSHDEATGEALSDVDLYLRKSEYLQKAGEEGLALGAASMAFEDDAATEEDVVAAYGRMIAIYASYEEYDKIAELLSNCTRPQVVDNYLQYALFDPEFSEDEGTYEDTLTLTIKDQGDGSIFYTLDGSVPDTSSLLYNGPIELTEGTYTVSAVYVNHFNLSSNVVTKTYTINSSVPAPPDVTPQSGTYAKQMKIEASVMGEDSGSESTEKKKDKSGKAASGEKKEQKEERASAVTGKIYYTTNGKDPTVKDSEYTEPIPMPEGDSSFRFAVISDAGISSEVVERNYTSQPSNSGPSTQANFTSPPTIRRHAPHIPVPSTMMVFMLTTVGISSFFVSWQANFIMIIGPITTQ